MRVGPPGKSSFINWYIGEAVCRTGVAIETRGFIFVTSGRKRETLTGESTLRYFDHLAGFGKFPGILVRRARGAGVGRRDVARAALGSGRQELWAETEDGMQGGGRGASCRVVGAAPHAGWWARRLMQNGGRGA